MERPISTYRTLLPFTTRAVVSDVSYMEHLSPDSPYREFACLLDKFDREPNTFPYWGVYQPGELLHDQDAEEMPRGMAFYRLRDGKIPKKAADGLMMYTTSVLFFDTLVRVTGSQSIKDGVLKHPMQKEWIGNSLYLEGLADLVQVLSAFIGNNRAAAVYASVPRPEADGNNTVRLANEIAATGGSIRALMSIRNIATVALIVSIMMKPYLQVPDNASQLGLNPDSPMNHNLRALFEKPRRLRLAMLLVTAVSPLVAFLDLDLTKHPVCPEEIILNYKRRGNEKPPQLQTMEDEVWREIMLVAEGKQNAFDAFQTLQSHWVRSGLLNGMRQDVRFYFSREQGGIVNYKPELSVYGACPTLPFPQGWPHPTLAQKYIDEATPFKDLQPYILHDDTDDPEATVPASTAFQRSGTNSNHPNPPTGAKMPRKGSSKKPRSPRQPREKARTGETNTRKTASSLRSSANVGDTDSEHSPPQVVDPLEDDNGYESDSIQLIDTWDVQEKDFQQREEMLDELLVRLEEYELFSRPHSQRPMVPIDVDNLTEKYSDSQDRDFELWDGVGLVRNVRPLIHHEDDYRSFIALYDAAKATHEVQQPGGRRMPAFLVDPSVSILRPCPFPDFQKMTGPEVQNLFHKQCPVILEAPGDLLNFDLNGLQTIIDVDTTIPIYDLSDRPDRQHSDGPKEGTLTTLYETSQADHANKKALHIGAVPNPHAAVTPLAYASDVRAVNRTQSLPHCLKFIPAGDVRFGVAATKGALVLWMLHADATAVRVAAGYQLFAIAVPKDAKTSASTKVYTDSMQDVGALDLSTYHVEAALLRPGDEIIIPPGTLYATLAVTDTLSHGARFLPSLCLRQVATAAVHAFFQARPTPSGHECFFARMNSLACFFYKCIVLKDCDASDQTHVPDYTTTEGLQSLILFTCAIELQNVMTPDSYLPTEEEHLLRAFSQLEYTGEDVLESYDVSRLTHENRLHNVYSRGRMACVLREAFSGIALTAGTGHSCDPWDDVYLPSLAWFICAFKDYYARVTASATQTADPPQACQPNCDDEDTSNTVLPPFHLFQMQLDWTSSRFDDLKSKVEQLEKESKVIESLIYPIPEISIRKVNTLRQSRSPADDTALFRQGLSIGDSLYFTARAWTKQDDSRAHRKRNRSCLRPARSQQPVKRRNIVQSPEPDEDDT